MTGEQPPLLRRAVETVRTLFDAAACSVALVDEAGEHLTYVAAAGEGAEHIVGTVLPVGKGLAGWAVMSGQPTATSDVTNDPRFARDVAESTHYVPHTILVAPFVDTDGEPLGVVSVLDPASADTGAALAVLGSQAALVGLLVDATARASEGTATPPADPATARFVSHVLRAVEEYREGPAR